MYDGKDKDMYLDTSKRQRTVLDDDTLSEAKNVFVDLAMILEDVISGTETMSSACRKRGYDYLSVRKIMMTSGFKNIKLDNPPLPIDEALPPAHDSYEYFYAAVFGLDLKTNFILPVDYKETVDYVLENTNLTDREVQVIKYRFRFDSEDETLMTLEKVGEEMNICANRVREIEDKAFRKLRHPSRAKILRKGKKQYDTDQTAIDKAYEKYKEANLPTSEDTLKEIEKLVKYPDSVRKISIDLLGLSVRSFNCLRRSGIATLCQLLDMQTEDFMKIRNLGRKSLEEVLGTLKKIDDMTDKELVLFLASNAPDKEELLKELEEIGEV